MVERLEAAIREAVNDPAFRSAMDKLKTPIVFKQGEEFRKFFEADARRLAEGVRRVGRIEEKKKGVYQVGRIERDDVTTRRCAGRTGAGGVLQFRAPWPS